MRYAVTIGLLLLVSCGSGSRLDPDELPAIVIEEKRWTETFIVIAGEDCPRSFTLPDPVRDPALMAIMVNQVPVPTWSCADVAYLQACSGPDDTTCECVRTWTCQVDSDTVVEFAEHYDLCDIEAGETVRIDIVYVLP
jgi:hypothetical protein